jgi:hypothetical protein
VQRLFSSFPGGAPGIGLLLLRAAVGVALVGQGLQLLGPGAGSAGVAVVSGVWIATGLAFLAGALTPAAAGLAAALVAALVFGTAPAPASVLLLAMVAALGLLGPGAYSVDARLFGRREIEVPRSERRRADTPEAVAEKPPDA